MIAHTIDASYSQPAQQAVYAQAGTAAAPCSISTGAYDDWNNVVVRCDGVIVPVGAQAAVHATPARYVVVPPLVSALASISEAPERPWFVAMLAGLVLTLCLRGFIFFSGGASATLSRSGA